MELVRLTRNKGAERFAKTALPNEIIEYLAKFFADLSKIRQDSGITRQSAEVSAEQAISKSEITSWLINSSTTAEFCSARTTKMASGLLTAPCSDADRIEQARKAIQSITASDSVADAARVMRLVGSHNSKKGNGEWL